jgi:hypothetical protein
MIVEEKLVRWNKKLIKMEIIHPQRKDNKAPKNHFLGIFVARVEVGKLFIYKIIKDIRRKEGLFK